MTRKPGTVQTPPRCPGGVYTSDKVEVALNWTGMSQARYTANMRRMVAAHELGHALGLGHTPAHPEWLMYPSDSRSVQVPQPNDKAGVNALY